MVSAIGVAEESTGEDLLDESQPVEETFECQECWPNVEEVRGMKSAKSPGLPTQAEREAHEETHLPFRSWCPECMAGRCPDQPHKSVVREESETPEVGMDYGFMSRKTDERSMTILVTKDRDTQVVMANVVLHKGRSFGDAVAQGVTNLKRLGHRQRFTLKTDNEPALLDLREAIMRECPGCVVPIQPPAGESQSNGSIENAVRQVKDLVRVVTLGLERKIGGVIPTHHAMMTWLVEHVGDLLTKHMVGKDGKTGFERLMGKPCREEGLELGEKVWVRRRKRDHG